MIILSIGERSGIWCVEQDGYFYGDYTRREWAQQAALEKARQLRLAGKSVRTEITDPRTNVTTTLKD